jgi:hypothetical protein
MEDIYLCTYHQYGFDIRIDKSKTMLFSLGNHLNKGMNNKEVQKRNMLRHNLVLLLEIIKLLQKLMANNSNYIQNICANKIYTEFVELVENVIGNSDHKINI